MVDDERGQLVLIGAVTVAVAVLGAVVLLNTVNSSPAAISETDARSVEKAQSTIEEVEGDLEQVALNRSNTGPRGPLPYIADRTELNQSVDKYEAEYLNLSTRDTSELVSIQYNRDATVNGSIAYDEDVIGGAVSPSNYDVINAIDGLRFYLNVTALDGGGGNALNINPSGAGSTLRIKNDGDISGGGGFSCTGITVPSDLPYELVVQESDIEVRSGETGEVYCSGTLDWEFSNDNLDFQVVDNNIEFSYQAIGLGQTAQCIPSQNQCVDDVPVVPAFNIVYQNPDVSVSSTIKLWGGT